MGCCSSTPKDEFTSVVTDAPIFTPKVPKSLAAKEQSEAAEESVAGLDAARPVRHGKWFAVDESYLADIDYEESCDIYSEFLQHHPNGGNPTAGLVAIRLSDAQVQQQRARTRIASYRWEGIKGVGAKGEMAIPSNYLVFLTYIRKHKLILWMDWSTNLDRLELCG